MDQINVVENIREIPSKNYIGFHVKVLVILVGF